MVRDMITEAWLERESILDAALPEVKPVYTKPYHDLMLTSYESYLGHQELMMRFGVDWVKNPVNSRFF